MTRGSFLCVWGLVACGSSTPPKPATRESITIPAGETWAASDSCVAAWNPEQVKQRVAAFQIDRDLVTCDEWKSCTAAGVCDESETYECIGNTKLVGRTDARAFCKWQSGRLPTWAEWSRAARGDSKELLRKDATKACVDVPTVDTRGHKTWCSYVGSVGMTFALFDIGGSEWTSETDCPQGAEVGDRAEVAVGRIDGNPERTRGIRAAFRCAK